MKKKILILPLLSVALLSRCNLNIFDFIDGGDQGHKEAKADDLSSIQEGNLYYAKESGNDFVTTSLLTNGAKLPYRKIGDVPYVTMSTALALVAPDNAKVSSNISGNIYTYKLTTSRYVSTIKVDSSNDTLTFDDYDKFSTSIISYSQINGICSIAEQPESYITHAKDADYVAGNETVFDLKGHSLDIIAFNEEVYLPFAIVSSTFFEPAAMSFAYNGNDFYLLNYTYFAKTGIKEAVLSSYANSFYSGALNTKGRTADFAAFNYNALCYQVDYFYGFSDKGYTPLDTYLGKKYPAIKANLKSTNNDKYQSAVNDLFYGVLGDGHTGTRSYSSVFGDGTNDITKTSFSDRYIQLTEDLNELKKIRTLSLGETVKALSYESNTAIIRFDSFVSAYKLLTAQTVTKYYESDSFAMFYAYFKSIEQKGNIKNIIIDLSLNGGGAADALVGILGFLTNSVDINIYNPLTKSKTKLHYAVDTNFDGKVDASDLMTSKYKFYILTSNYSFSCANLFPTVCKESKLATIIGEKSGGGACVVRSSATADGIMFNMSGTSRLCTVSEDGTFTDNDNGVAPDYTSLNRKYFYDNKTLASFVESK